LFYFQITSYPSICSADPIQELVDLYGEHEHVLDQYHWATIVFAMGHENVKDVLLPKMRWYLSGPIKDTNRDLNLKSDALDWMDVSEFCDLDYLSEGGWFNDNFPATLKIEHCPAVYRRIQRQVDSGNDDSPGNLASRAQDAGSAFDAARRYHGVQATLGVGDEQLPDSDQYTDTDSDGEAKAGSDDDEYDDCGVEPAGAGAVSVLEANAGAGKLPAADQSSSSLGQLASPSSKHDVMLPSVLGLSGAKAEGREGGVSLVPSSVNAEDLTFSFRAKKRGRFNTALKDRYFVCTKHPMQAMYYASEADANAKRNCKGTIQVTSVRPDPSYQQSCRGSVWDSSGRIFHLKLTNSGDWDSLCRFYRDI
jgi:hypothetical protein